jgi:L-lactate dehydrogenase complex protein LldG
MTARETFLANVRSAVAAGNQAGQARGLPSGPRVAYQGGGPTPVQRFLDELRAAGGQGYVTRSDEHAAELVMAIVTRSAAKKAILSGDLVNRLQLKLALRDRGVEAVTENELQANAAKEALFAAEIGITGVDWLIAETGSVVLGARPGQARSPSLLPPTHIAVAERAQLLPDLFDLFDHALITPSRPHPLTPSRLPSCLTIITGPSKTGDIELKLVTGVHGPGELHVVLIDS